MNSPLDADGFTFGLEFKSLGFPDIYKTTEFVGFDASSFVIKQEDGRFGRDVSYGNEDTEFEFYDINVEKSIAQVQEPSGRVSVYLDMGLKWILETKNRFGYEGEIYFHLFKDGLQFNVGRLDLSQRNTDGLTYFKCKILQNNKVELYKKNFSTSIDLFSTKGIKDQNITPAPTLKVLRRALSLLKRSAWNYIDDNIETFITFAFSLLGTDTRTYVWNYCQKIIEYEIDDTLTFLQGVTDGERYSFSPENTRYLKSKYQLKNVKVKISNLIWEQNTVALAGGNGYVKNKFIIRWGYSEDNPIGEFIPIDNFLSDGNNITNTINQTFTIPYMPTGCYLYIYFYSECRQSSDFGGEYRCQNTISKYTIEIEAYQKSLDIVIPMVRYIDILKQCSKVYNNLYVNAPMFDFGGEFYNNACWNRALLSLQTSNSLELISTTNPNGELGQVVNNVNINGSLPLGLYFWNGTNWIALNSSLINDLFLTSETTPSGIVGELINNINPNVTPLGLCFWNGTSWQGLEYSRPFLTSLEDAYSKSMTIETCSDYQITNDEIYFGEFKNYYENTEIGQFTIIPSEEIDNPNNDRFLINNIKFGFDTYDTNRLTENSAKDIFTEAEWNNPNLFVENKFERSIKYIRSGISSQVIVDLEINKPQTANENDDKVFINSIVELPSNNYFEETFNLLMNVTNGQVQILNKNLNQNVNEVIINWLTFGFSVGDNFEIISGQNSGSYTISTITQTILTLTPIGFTPTYIGDSVIKIKFFYNSVFWQTETDEIVKIKNGLNVDDKYPNLNFSLRRIFERWKTYFASANLFHQDKKIRNLKFVNNPPLKSQIGTEPILEEKGSILVTDLGNPILTSEKWVVKTTISFSEMLAFLNTLRTVRGFIRCYNSDAKKIIKGYVQELKYTWANCELEFTIEEKFEPKIITLVFANGILTVNDVIYNLGGNVNWWKITGDHFICFDSKNIPLCNIRRYDEVSYNGVIYTNITDLLIALTS